MIRIEHRKVFRSNGLIDDFVVHGTPADYLELAGQVRDAARSQTAQRLATESGIRLEVLARDDQTELFTSLQNESGFYASLQDWEARDTLRVVGSSPVLGELAIFLAGLAGRGEGYSYISEYSGKLAYSAESPEWRLHVLAI